MQIILRNCHVLAECKTNEVSMFAQKRKEGS